MSVAVDYAVPVGKIVYTQFLKCCAGLRRMSLSRACPRRPILVVTPAATRLADRDMDAAQCGRLQCGDHGCHAGEGVLAVMGPNARQLMQAVSPAILATMSNPFGTAQEIELGMGLAVCTA